MDFFNIFLNEVLEVWFKNNFIWILFCCFVFVYRYNKNIFFCVFVCYLIFRIFEWSFILIDIKCMIIFCLCFCFRYIFVVRYLLIKVILFFVLEIILYLIFFSFYLVVFDGIVCGFFWRNLLWWFYNSFGYEGVDYIWVCLCWLCLLFVGNI